MLNFRIGLVPLKQGGPKNKKSERLANKRLQYRMIISKAAGRVLFPFRAVVSHIQSATVYHCALRALVSSFVRWFVIVHVCVGLLTSYADFA